MPNEGSWLPDGYENIPPQFLWRILPSAVRQQVACSAIQEAAAMLSNKKVATVIHDAAQKAQKAAGQNVGQAVQPHIQASHGGSAQSDDLTCGNDLSALLNWLRHHGTPPGPAPGPWFDLSTIGMIGQFAAKVGGPVRTELATVLRGAVKEYIG